MIIPSNKKNAIKTLKKTEKTYWLKKLLVDFTWYDSSKLKKIELTPFAVKKIDKIKTDDKRPTLGLLLISIKISLKKMCVSFGKIISTKLNTIMSKFSIGINGIKFKIKSKKGNNAIKKLNEILPARVVIVPFTIPRAYIFKKSNNDKPFNPGSFVNLSMFINDLYTLRDLIFPFTFI